MLGTLLNMTSGFLLVDKPAGITSFGVIGRLRKITGIKKIGHAGTLDPFATGLLIIAVGRNATKEIANYVKLDKTYEATFCFGATTETLDTEKPVELDPSFKPASITKEAVESVLKTFIGEIQQVPPIYSAIKMNGERAYDLARAGKEVVMQPRTVTISRFVLNDLKEENGLIFTKITVDCGSGTYIRSLAKDIAQKLGTTGYVTELRRTRIGDRSIENAKTIEQLESTWATQLFH